MFQTFQITPKHAIHTAAVEYNRTEEMHDYLSKLGLNLNHLQNIKNLKRRAEWLFIREIMIKNMPKGEDIIYDEHRKPRFKNSSNYLSISHSNERVALSINEERETGIDLQFITDKILRIRDKFLNDAELKRTNNNSLELTCHWCIKEALFKIYGKKDAFLRENFEIVDFNFKNNFGIAKGLTRIGGFQSEHKMELRKLGDYMMAYNVNY